MKKTIAFLLLFIAFSPSVMAQNSNVGLVKNTSGQVLIVRDSARLSVQKGDHLNKSDVVETGPDGSVGIVFTDGTTVAIGPETEFHIQNYRFAPEVNTYAFSLYLKKGSAIYNSGKIGKLAPESVKLNTPKATVGIRGTRLILEVK